MKRGEARLNRLLIPVSLFRLRLTSKRPSSLRMVEITAEVEGKVVLSELMEAEDDLEIELRWDGRDAYGQKVTGKAEVKVRVGYRFVVQSS